MPETGGNTLKHQPYCPHPWHGLSPGDHLPSSVRAFVEITRFDAIKYEIDPVSGYLRVDRPQANSCLPPMMYGFVPKTLCGDNVAQRIEGASEGDGDALDICILSEHAINRPQILLDARIIGGLSTLDNGKADPKVLAVLECDLEWGNRNQLEEVQPGLLKRIQHYFQHYKGETGGENPVRVLDWMERDDARDLLMAARKDYDRTFSTESEGDSA